MELSAVKLDLCDEFSKTEGDGGETSKSRVSKMCCRTGKRWMIRNAGELESKLAGGVEPKTETH